MSIVQTERVIGVYHYDYTDSTTGSHDGSDKLRTRLQIPILFLHLNFKILTILLSIFKLTSKILKITTPFNMHRDFAQYQGWKDERALGGRHSLPAGGKGGSLTPMTFVASGKGWVVGTGAMEAQRRWNRRSAWAMIPRRATRTVHKLWVEHKGQTTSFLWRVLGRSPFCSES